MAFTVPAEEAKSVAIVGLFKEWNAESMTLKKLKNGAFKGTMNLETNTAHEFKSVIDTGVYIKWKQTDMLGIIFPVQQTV